MLKNNFGINLTLFKERLVMSFDYFRNTTKDQLMTIPLPASTGSEDIVVNFGENQNVGYDFSVAGQVIRNRYMYYASCIVVPIGFGITRDSWLNADPDYNLLQFAAAILIGLTGAGYALRRQVRRDADKVAKSNDAHD